nr:unnamed protein product [Callosobruchus chinensis]
MGFKRTGQPSFWHSQPS